jgi:hypothetical protein
MMVIMLMMAKVIMTRLTIYRCTHEIIHMHLSMYELNLFQDRKFSIPERSSKDVIIYIRLTSFKFTPTKLVKTYPAE